MTLLFPDVSEYTPNVDPAQYPVLIARATLSDRVSDPTYATFKARSAKAGTVFLAYHWLNHGNLKAQAAWCFQHVGPGTPVMIDAEDVAGNTGYAGPLTVDDVTGFAAEYRALGGIVSLVYMPFWYWAGPMNAPHTLDQITAAGLHLVSSNYPTAGYTEAGPGWAAYYPGAPVPVQWQYTSTPIDMNAYRGTVDEYVRMVGGDMAVEICHDVSGDTSSSRLTQGSAGYAGQQRDTAWAFTWQAAVDANTKLDKLLAAQAVPAPMDTHALATDIAQQLVAANTNGLTDADLSAVRAVVVEVLNSATVHAG